MGNRFEEMYKQKLASPEEVAKYVKSGFICACPTALGEPSSIIQAVGERAKKGEIENVYQNQSGSSACEGIGQLRIEKEMTLCHCQW